jgi:ABC-2 type transport system permease protein
MTPTTHLRLAPRWKYLSFALMSAQRTLFYRRTLLLNLLASSIGIIISFYIWQTVFASQTQIATFTWDRMRTYLLLAYAVNLLFNASSSVFRVMLTIRNGNVAYELIRPFDFMQTQLFISLGSVLAEGLFSISLVILIGGFALKILPPASPLSLLLFIISVMLGFLIKFLIKFLVALACFWTLNWLGLYLAQNAVVNIFSGALIPLDFFPGWLYVIAKILPFQGIVHIPLAIYLGDLQGVSLWQAFGFQLLWIVVLWITARLVWFPSLRALEIQGG